jgi:H+/Cl- antiporter ClcA
MSNSWFVWLLPVGGVVIVFCYKICRMADDKGTNMILESVRSTEQLSGKMAPLIFVSTIVTHLVGGSAGREGAALQLGGSLGYQIGKWVHLDQKDLRIITMCGMSAGFSALFRTPLTAAVFSMEVVSVGVMYYSALVPCVLAALIGYVISGYFGMAAPSYAIAGVPALSIVPVLQVLLLAVLCAGLSILFCIALHKSAKLYRKYLQNQYLRIVVGGALIVILTCLLRTTDYLGAGMNVIQKAMTAPARPEAFVLKMLFTAITLGAGYKGGEIVPAFFVGATFGNVVGGLIGLNSSFGAAVGLMAVFCGVTNCPMTAFFVSIELFGVKGALYFLIAAAVSYMLSGYYGLYSKQKIMYSKFKPQFIDKFSK